ncbi:hypothetical protein D8J80_03255 [Campylobacter upsaliensis]|nr:hypothetical protein [Campylobacter upsaliensis]
MKDFDFLRKANLKGKIWLNAEHLGGCAFRFLLQTRGVFVTHRTRCDRYRLRSYFSGALLRGESKLK